MSDALPPGVRHLIARGLDSADAVEVLLLLARQDAAARTVRELARELRSSEMAAQKSLAKLERMGLVVREGVTDPAFRFAAGHPAAPVVLGELDSAWRDRRVALLEALYTERDSTG